MRRPAVGLLLAALAIGAAAPLPAVEALELIRVADSSMPVPGGTSTLLIEASRPAPCELGVVFYAIDFATVATGIYVATPFGVERLVDETTAVPEGEGAFRDLDQPVCDGATVVFRGQDAGTGLRGVYRWSGGTIEPVVVQGTPVPGRGAGTGLSGFGALELAADRLAFQLSIVPVGIGAIAAVDDDGLAIVADTASPVPGHPESHFTEIFAPTVAPGGVAFLGEVSELGRGLYLATHGGLSALVERGAELPGGAPGETFQSLGAPRWSTDGSAVLFPGRGDGGSGIFSVSPSIPDTFRVLIPPGLPAPSGEPFLDAFRPIPLTRGFAFIGLTEPLRETLYVVWDGRLQRVVGKGDVLDGKRVSSLIPGGRGDRLAVRVYFVGNSQALYAVSLGSLIEIPALSPAGVALLALLLALAGARQLAHRRKAFMHK